ncbi:MAG: histone deacetylase [Hyphomicrobiaceae bacterium]|nr:histone deacetylase [Hyphomicrobiaceae bacterium]
MSPSATSAPALYFYPDTVDIPVPAGHRFPAMKYRRLLDAVQREAILPASLMAPSPIAARDLLVRVHDEAYVDRVLDGRLAAHEVRDIGIPWSEAFVLRARATVGGTLAAARAALRDGHGGQLAGGTHHAHYAHGAGFCLFNDVATTAVTLLDEGRAGRVAILDCDVHQGDGTASLLADEPRVYTVSLHGAANYPFAKATSNLDIALAEDTGDADYLAALATALAAISEVRPDLLLYISGADPLADDRLGRLALTLAGLAERDRRVFSFCAARDIPVAIVIGGGYAEPIDVTVAGYLGTYRALRDVFG